MISHQHQIQKTVRYYTIGNADVQRKHLWVCLHGYGQLGEWFAHHFEKFARKDRLFLIPEAPHRFYVEGTTGRVGASWMTREDRLADINDQFQYLENLLGDVLPKLHPQCKVHVLGFSQGVATALRWIDKTRLKIASLICWAGTFPPDINYALNRTQFENMLIYAFFGDDDEFISPHKAEEMLIELKSQGIVVTPVFYYGKHRLYGDLLADVIHKCEENNR